MRTLYLDCGMGAAGDMLTAALLELLPDKDGFLAELNGLGIPGVVFEVEKREKCGILGTHMCVKIQGEEEGQASGHPHHHGSMDSIKQIVYGLPIPAMVKLDILSVYEEIAQAESHVHGVPVAYIHFHEVGAMDAVADVTAVCLLMHRLDVDRVVVSPIQVGSGQVRCAHGILPVPAPATAYLLRDIPIYSGTISGELCTPTGAALLRHFATEFGQMPVMRVSAMGYGMGKKDFERANCVRAMLGQTEDAADDAVELCCNLDDMTGEGLGFAMERLLEAGALDVFTSPIGMKKNRPGVKLSVLCRESQQEAMATLLLKHTTTLGVRVFPCRRYTLNRRVETLSTPYGPVRKKVSEGYGVRKEKLEYDDLEKIGKEQGLSLAQVLEKIRPNS